MASIRDLRQRIKSVGNIRQITRAMEMVATTKLRRFQERAVASRPYAREIAGLVGRLAAMLGDDVGDRPLFKQGAGEHTAILLVTSDRGLCGAYNSNLFRFLEQWLREHPGVKPRYFVYGRKGYQYLCRRGREAEIERYLVEPVLELTDYRAAARTSNLLVQAFQSGQCKDVVIVYSAFESMARYVPTAVPLLPIQGGNLSGAADTGA
ncbi:MAG: F0F1 ATP synthase subunit gamma, partial [Planctomycetota bacterium]